MDLNMAIDTGLDYFTGGLWSTVEDNIFKGDSKSAYKQKNKNTGSKQVGRETNQPISAQPVGDTDRNENVLAWGDFEMKLPESGMAYAMPLIVIIGGITIWKIVS